MARRTISIMSESQKMMYVVYQQYYDDFNIVATFHDKVMADALALELEGSVTEVPIFTEVVRPRVFFCGRTTANRNYFGKDVPRSLKDASVLVSSSVERNLVWPWDVYAEEFCDTQFQTNVYVPYNMEGCFNLSIHKTCRSFTEETTVAQLAQFEAEVRALPDSFWQTLFDQAMDTIKSRREAVERERLRELRHRHSVLIPPEGGFISTSDPFRTKLSCKEDCPCRALGDY